MLPREQLHKKLTNTLYTEDSFFLGIDGYIDSLYRVVRKRTSIGEAELFSTISSFSERLAQAAGKSSDTELLLEDRRIGGNAPVMAKALECLNVPIVYAGLFDEETHQNSEMKNSKWYSLGKPCETIAFEFSDGKLMFGQTEQLRELGWKSIQEHMGLEVLCEELKAARFWGMLNWSAHLKLEEIIEEILKLNILEEEQLLRKWILFDISDPSTRETQDVCRFLSLIKRINEKANVILGLNENELMFLADCCGLQQPATLEEAAELLIQQISVERITVHLRNRCFSVTKQQTVSVPGIFVSNPRISTGGGDHFNAGYCAGLLWGLSEEMSLALGNAVAAYYVTYGESPTQTKLQMFLST